MIDPKKIQQRLAELASLFGAYIDLTQKDRTTLTKGDRRRIANIEGELAQLLEPEERSDLTVDVGTVARFFGVTARQVQNWVKQKGCPRLKHGLYDLKAVHTWWFEEILGVDSREIEDAKLKYWKWKAEGEKVRVEQAKEDLIPIEQIAEAWAWRMAEVTTGLQSLASRLPPLLEGKTQGDMRAVIEAEVWKMRDSYCRSGKFCECSAE